MNQNKDFKTFLENLQDEDKKEFLSFMEEQAGAGRDAAEACIKYAAGKGYQITEEQVNEAAGAVPLSADDLDDVAGGTCFTAGTPSQQRKWSCPAHCQNAYRTGNEKEDPFFIYWSRHMKEYYCPDCHETWWEHED